VVVLAVALTVLCGCSGGNSNTTQVAGAEAAAPGQVQPQYSQSQQVAAPQSYGGSYRRGTATGDTQEGANFAHWVLDQDPSGQYITDAVVRGDQSLGVKVQPTMTRADVQQLLSALTQGMAQTFPGRPLEVVAFYQSGAKLAESLYDPRTGQANIQFAQ
jgi:outer membrane biogenesis lipoprotein LolB